VGKKTLYDGEGAGGAPPHFLVSSFGLKLMGNEGDVVGLGFSRGSISLPPSPSALLPPKGTRLRTLVISGPKSGTQLEEDWEPGIRGNRMDLLGLEGNGASCIAKGRESSPLLGTVISL
jgi:hypothetical protein